MSLAAALDHAFEIDPVHEQMLRVALLRDGRAEERWRALRREIDLDEFWDGKALDFLPLVYRTLADEGADDPDLPRLRGVQRRTWLANQLRFRTLGAAITVLHDRGIETLVLKGSAWALTVYPDSGLRPMYDCDLLVHPDQVEHALAALGDAGWSATDPLPRRFARHHQEVDVVGPDERIVDLHWHVAVWLVGAGEERTADDGFWRRSVPLDVAGAATRALDSTDALLHAVLHGARNGWRAAPQWVPDATLIVERGGPIEWDRIADIAVMRQVALPVRRGLAYLRAAFDVPVPPTVLARLDVRTSRRSRRMFARTGQGMDPTPTEIRLLGPFAASYRFWVAQSAPMDRRRAAVEFPRWLADHWHLDRPLDVPAAGLRRVFGQVRRAVAGSRLSTRPFR